jgi:hypothetical protein
VRIGHELQSVLDDNMAVISRALALMAWDAPRSSKIPAASKVEEPGQAREL